MSLAFSKTLRSLEHDRSRWGVVFAMIAVAVMVPWIIWFFVAEVRVYTTALTADTVVAREPHAVEAQTRGRLIAVDVELGEYVEKDALLFSLDIEGLDIEHADILANRAALEAELRSISEELKTRRLNLELVATESTVRNGQARETARMAREEAELDNTRRARLERLLSEGFISHDEAETARASASKQASRARRSRGDVRLESLRGRRDTSDRTVALHQLERIEAELLGRVERLGIELRRVALERTRSEVRAPVSGHVAELSDNQPGSTVQFGERLATIVPEGPLLIRARFASTGTGHIGEGDTAVFRLSGFPWPQYGSIAARVIRVGSESEKGFFQAHLEMVDTSTYRGPLEHGLPGELFVETERSSPFFMLLRSVGALHSADAEGSGTTR